MREKTWISGPPSGSPGKQVLENLYIEQRHSYKEIASRYGVTAQTVLRWIWAAGISPRNPREGQLASPRYVGYSDDAKVALRARLAVARSSPLRGQRISEAQKGRVPWNKGKPASEETKAKFRALRADPEYRKMMSEKFKGEKSVHWQGGPAPGTETMGNDWQWRQRRRECYERDRWVCQECREPCGGKGKRRIQAHHVIPRRLGGSDDLDNLVTLCARCHGVRERKFKGALIV